MRHPESVCKCSLRVTGPLGSVPKCRCEFRFAVQNPYHAEMTEELAASVPSGPGIAMIHLSEPFANTGEHHASCQHYLVHSTVDIRAMVLSMVDGVDKGSIRPERYSNVVNVANAKGIRWTVGTVWTGSAELVRTKFLRMFKSKNREDGCRKCNHASI